MEPAMNIIPPGLDPWLILLLAVATSGGYLVGWISRKAHEAELIAPLKRLLDDFEAAEYRRTQPPLDYERRP
jgi:hypothetical protein